MNSTLFPSMSLSDVIHGLRGSVGRWAVLGWISSLLGLLVYRRLGEILGRMERLSARFQAGRLRRSGQRRRVDTRPTKQRLVELERIWPSQFGWLVRAASWQAAGFGGQLRGVLAQPEMIALLIACPQAVRVLTPLCRMLAVETSLLQPGVVMPEMVAEAAPVVAKRVRAKRPPVDWGRIPIPRGVLSAVRRRGFAKDG